MPCSRVSFAVVLPERYRAREQAEAMLLHQLAKPKAPLAHARGTVPLRGFYS